VCENKKVLRFRNKRHFWGCQNETQKGGTQGPSGLGYFHQLALP